MKRLIWLLCVWIFFGNANAQFVPYTTQPFQFAPIFNPAYTGIEDYLDMRVSQRYQWNALGADAPRFSLLSVNFRSKHPVDLRSNAPRPSRPDYSRVVPKRKRSYHGLGFNVFNSKIGPLHEYGAGAQYGLHFPVNKKVTFSAGAGVMYENSRLKGGNSLFWGEAVDRNDPIYLKMQEGDISQTSISTRAGALVYSERFYFGLTYYPLNHVMESRTLAFNDQFYTGGFQAGYSFRMNEDFVVKPSILGLLHVDNSVLIDYHVKFYLQEKGWFGATYRDIKAGALSGGLNINSTLTFAYSYEFAMGQLRFFSGATHELILSGRLRNYKKQETRTW